jgi:hypothetical protein
MLDINDLTQLLESIGIRTHHKLVLKAIFSGWKKDPGTAFETLASAKADAAKKAEEEASAAAIRIAGKPNIYNAASDGDFELVRNHVIADPACVNKLRSGCCNPGWAPLHHSSWNCHLEVCQFLVASKADVNSKTAAYRSLSTILADGVHLYTDEGHLSPLHCSSATGSLEICKLLVASKADVNAQTRDSSTPLHYCCTGRWVEAGCGRRHVEVCQFLLACKANIAARDRDGNNPLKLAFVTMSGRRVNRDDTSLRKVIDYLRSIGAPE